jgi:hypothetical protein
MAHFPRESLRLLATSGALLTQKNVNNLRTATLPQK